MEAAVAEVFQNDFWKFASILVELNEKNDKSLYNGQPLVRYYILQDRILGGLLLISSITFDFSDIFNFIM